MTGRSEPRQSTSQIEPYYDDGTVTLYHGDSREILPALQPADFAALVTDPPYGIEHESNWQSSWTGTQIHGDADTAARDAVIAWWGDGPAIVFGSWKRQRPASAHTLLIWDKGPASGMGDLSIPWKPSHEEIYVIGRGFAGKRDEGVLRYVMVTWESQGRKHPHAKPPKLMQHLLQKCPAGTILDPFAGSGTTLRAAKDLGRRAVGIEIEEHYCEDIVRSLAQEVLDVASS